MMEFDRILLDAYSLLILVTTALMQFGCDTPRKFAG